MAITVAGWLQVKPTLGTGIPGRCFVAMSFHADLDPAYFDGIPPALEECGMESRRLKELHHNEYIYFVLLAEIKHAAFSGGSHATEGRRLLRDWDGIGVTGLY